MSEEGRKYYTEDVCTFSLKLKVISNIEYHCVAPEQYPAVHTEMYCTCKIIQSLRLNPRVYLMHFQMTVLDSWWVDMAFTEKKSQKQGIATGLIRMITDKVSFLRTIFFGYQLNVMGSGYRCRRWSWFRYN